MKRFLLSLAAVAGLSLATTAQAQTSTTITVSASVAKKCVITGGGAIVLGAYDPEAATDLSGAATVDVKCTNKVPWTVTPSAPTSADNKYELVNASDSAESLTFTLHDGSATGTVVDDTHPIARTGNGATQSNQIFAVVGAGQTNASVGSYSGSVTLNLTF